MLALERLLPVAASTSLIVIPMGPSATSRPVLEQPMRQGQPSAWLGREAVAVSPTHFFLPAAVEPHRHDLFTSRDMAVLDAVDRAVARDDLDYSGLFDYDDD